MYINIFGLLFIILVVLKLMGYIVIGWFWIFLLITLPFIIVGGCLAIALIIGGILGLIILGMEKWG
jgi:hypothetical protein